VTHRGPCQPPPVCDSVSRVSVGAPARLARGLGWCLPRPWQTQQGLMGRRKISSREFHPLRVCCGHLLSCKSRHRARKISAEASGRATRSKPRGLRAGSFQQSPQRAALQATAPAPAASSRHRTAGSAPR